MRYNGSKEKEMSDILNTLINTSNSIKKIYYKLYELEINDKKDTEEYKLWIEILKDAIAYENKLYNDKRLTQKTSQRMVENLYTQLLENRVVNELESLVTHNYEFLATQRVYLRLKDKAEDTINESMNMFDTTAFVSSDEDINDFLEIILRNFSDNSLVKPLNIDVFNSYLCCLNDSINNVSLKKYKNDFIKNKYCVAFLNASIEYNMIASNFLLSDNYQTYSRFFADMIDVDLKDFRVIKNKYAGLIFNCQMHEVLRIANRDYDNSKKAIESILRQCIIRALLLQMTDEVILDYNLCFFCLLQSNEYKDMRVSPNAISEEAILSCFEQVEKDKNKRIEISLNRSLKK